MIQPAVHFIVYTPRNGDICKKAIKNIPPAWNAPGISSPTPGYDSLSALVCFHRTREWILILYSWMALCFFLNRWHWKTQVPHKAEACHIFGPECLKFIGELFGKLVSMSSTLMGKWMQLCGELNSLCAKSSGSHLEFLVQGEEVRDVSVRRSPSWDGTKLQQDCVIIFVFGEFLNLRVRASGGSSPQDKSSSHACFSWVTLSLQHW